MSDEPQQKVSWFAKASEQGIQLIQDTAKKIMSGLVKKYSDLSEGDDLED